MTLKFHGPGNVMDQHNNDTAAHPGLVSTADFAGPEIIAPPGSLFAASAASAWHTTNGATFMRFQVHNVARRQAGGDGLLLT